jgi:hypothetical protein
MMVVIQAVVKVIAAKRQVNIIMAVQLFIRREIISEITRSMLNTFETKCKLG